MFAIDPKLQAQLRPFISKVLILEDNPAYARMLSDMFRMLGADNVIIERSDAMAMTWVEDVAPDIIVTEYGTPTIDGLEFTRKLRRSPHTARKAPVIMVKADITAAQLTEARNAGVHEMMARPFAWKDLLARLRNVVTKPRDWIDAQSYVGPDRRRFNTGGEFSGLRKRNGEADSAARTAAEESVRLMRIALDLLEDAPDEAKKTLFTELAALVPAAKQLPNREFLQTVGQLVSCLRTGKLTRDNLEPVITSLMNQLGISPRRENGWARNVLKEKSDDMYLDIA